MALDWGLVLGATGVIGIPVAIGVGVTMANPTARELRFARLCFWTAAGLSLIAIAWLTHEIPLSFGKIIATGVVGAAITIGLVIGLDWIDGRNKASEIVKTNTQTPNISFQKFALFWVETEKNVYYLGVVAKLFNLDPKPHLINGITLDKTYWNLIPRGGYLIQRYVQFQDHVEIIEDNYIKAGDVGYYKKLLPIRIEMIVEGGEAPDFMLLSRWNFVFENKTIPIMPELYAPYETFISEPEWEDLLKPKSKIDINNLHFKKLSPGIAEVPSGGSGGQGPGGVGGSGGSGPAAGGGGEAGACQYLPNGGVICSGGAGGGGGGTLRGGKGGGERGGQGGTAR